MSLKSLKLMCGFLSAISMLVAFQNCGEGFNAKTAPSISEDGNISIMSGATDSSLRLNIAYPTSSSNYTYGMFPVDKFVLNSVMSNGPSMEMRDKTYGSLCSPGQCPSILWSQISGPAQVTIEGDTTSNPKIVASSITTKGRYFFQVHVSGAFAAQLKLDVVEAPRILINNEGGFSTHVAYVSSSTERISTSVTAKATDDGQVVSPITFENFGSNLQGRMETSGDGILRLYDLPVGDYVYVAFATDNEGNVGSRSFKVSVQARAGTSSGTPPPVPAMGLQVATPTPAPQISIPSPTPTPIPMTIPSPTAGSVCAPYNPINWGVGCSASIPARGQGSFVFVNSKAGFTGAITMTCTSTGQWSASNLVCSQNGVTTPTPAPTPIPNTGLQVSLPTPTPVTAPFVPGVAYPTPTPIPTTSTGTGLQLPSPTPAPTPVMAPFVPGVVFPTPTPVPTTSSSTGLQVSSPTTTPTPVMAPFVPGVVFPTPTPTPMPTPTPTPIPVAMCNQTLYNVFIYGSAFAERSYFADQQLLSALGKVIYVNGNGKVAFFSCVDYGGGSAPQFLIRSVVPPYSPSATPACSEGMHALLFRSGSTRAALKPYFADSIYKLSEGASATVIGTDGYALILKCNSATEGFTIPTVGQKY